MMARLFLTFAVLAAIGAGAEPGKDPDAKKSHEPKLSSMFPMSGQRGTSFAVVVRGANLSGARALLFGDPGFEGRILSQTSEEVSPGESTPKDLVKAQIVVASDATLGSHSLRLITANGLSNTIPLDVVAEPILDPATPSAAIDKFPVVINGRIPRPGDTNSYSIEVTAGDTLTFEASAAPGGLDPSIAVLEPSGSWFDPNRLNQVAYNDEPLSFPGLSTDARLVHRFAHAGRYVVRIQGFEGQGGADCVYRLRIVKGVSPSPKLHPMEQQKFEERQFTRSVAARLAQVSERGGLELPKGSVETFRAVPEGTKDIPVMKLPAIVEGRLDHPAEAQVIRLHIEKPCDIAIEVETPEATLPRFNPVVRLIDPTGREIATDVYTKLNNNGLYMMKMIEAKTTVTLTAAGEYTLQIHEITTNGAGPDFLYRILLRPQVPHVGKLELAEEHLNLEAGSSHPVTVTVDREEGLKDYVTVAVEGLPDGVTAVPALEDHAEPPPLPNGGRLERYVAKPQRAAVMLVAAEGARVTDAPVRVRFVANVLRDGRILKPVATKEMLIMVVPARKS